MFGVDNQIIQDYLKGLTFREIQRKYKVGQKRIELLLDKEGIKRYSNHERAILKRTNYQYTYKEISDKVVFNYVNKEMGQLASGREFNLSQTQVVGILKKRGIERRDFSTAAKIRNKKFRKYDNNSDYFKVESHNMAYILGFIAADGTITKKENSIKITLAKKDREILEKIKEEIGIGPKIKDATTSKGHDISTLNWTEESHKKDLAKYTIIPEKTFKLKPPYQLNRKYWIDYIRGYFDGDGSINLIKSSRGNGALRWQVCSATKEILDFIVDFFYEEYGIDKVNVQMQYRKKPLYYIQYSNTSTRKIYKILYTQNSLFLKRKKDHFEEIIERIKPLK